MKEIAFENSIHCDTEYSALKHVVVVKPSFMKITKVINETQKHYKESNISIPLALRQHERFLHVLREHQVEITELPADPELHEQVYTRDIGVTIHSHVCICSMYEKVRKKETAHLKAWLQHNAIPFHELSGSIEGGDVILHGTTLWVGIGRRTSFQAVENLRNIFPAYRVEPLTLRKDILHLDCVFNILSDDTALVYTPAFSSDDLRKIKSRFEIIPVTKEEQFYMGPNVLSIGNRKVISLPQNIGMNDRMKEKGFEVITIDFSEIIKSGGSFRCCTLPLKRE